MQRCCEEGGSRLLLFHQQLFCSIKLLLRAFPGICAAPCLSAAEAEGLFCSPSTSLGLAVGFFPSPLMLLFADFSTV